MGTDPTVEQQGASPGAPSPIATAIRDLVDKRIERAITPLTARIEDPERRIAELERQVAELERRLLLLEARLV